MRKTLAIILLMAMASLPVMGNIYFREGGAVWLSDGGTILFRSEDIATSTPPASGGMSPNDVTATMTAAAAPVPNKVYAVTSYGMLGDPWHAFDHNITSTGTYDQHAADRAAIEFAFDFGASFPHAIQTVRFLGKDAGQNPKSFKIKASNGAATTTLYIGTGTPSIDWQEFSWTNTTEYRFISFENVSTQSGTAFKIFEIEYWETQP